MTITVKQAAKLHRLIAKVIARTSDAEFAGSYSPETAMALRIAKGTAKKKLNACIENLLEKS